jgi:DNA-directed RNA polymerase specialized sigma24 family protein
MDCQPAPHPALRHDAAGPALRSRVRRRPRRAAAPPGLTLHGAQAEPTTAGRGRALLETHFVLVRKKLLHLGRRSGLPAHEAEEFGSWALYKLVENDYRILGSWEGRSSLSTYLTVVLFRLMQDYRVQVWGRWRPSAAARREGGEAVLLERLLACNGLSVGEAVARVRDETGIALPDEQVERIAAGLPGRARRRSVSVEQLHFCAVDGQVETRIEAGERARTAELVRRVLSAAWRELPAEDGLLLELHFAKNLTIASISRMLRKPQRDLYLRRNRCLARLRRKLEEAGLEADQVRQLVAGAGTGESSTLVR